MCAAYAGVYKHKACMHALQKHMATGAPQRVFLSRVSTRMIQNFQSQELQPKGLKVPPALVSAFPPSTRPQKGEQMMVLYISHVTNKEEKY